MTRTSEKAPVPRLRFKGCEGVWEEKSLCGFASINPRANIPEQFEYVDLESVVGTKMISHRTENRTTAPSRAQRLAFAGDIFFQTVRPYQKNNFYFDAENQTYVFSTGYAQLRPYVNGKALFNGLQSDAFVRRVLLNCTGSSYPAINPTMLGQLLLSMPKDDCEAVCIGRMFECLDACIDKGESRLTSLRQLKRAMLVKMFPRLGRYVPEIRFNGFDEKWEMSLLSRYLAVSDCVNVDDAYDANDVLSVSGEYGVVNQIEFQGRSFAGASLKNYHVLRHGQVTYTKSPLKQCPYGIVKTNKGADGIVSSLYGVYNAKPGVDAEFVQVYFDNHDRLNAYLRPLVNKGAKNTLLISDENALSGEVCFPSFEEQRKIAAFFRNLDRVIGAAEKKVAKLRQVKASLLERMFV